LGGTRYLIWNGGLAIQGGVAFGIAAGLIVIFFYRKSIDYRVASSIIIPNILLGQSIGRWGNFANAELFGADVSRESLLWMGEWAVDQMNIYTSLGGAASATYRYPIFLFESLTTFAGYIICAWYFSLGKFPSFRANYDKPKILGFIPRFEYDGWKTVKPGVSAAWYLIIYGIIRVVNEPLRAQGQMNQNGNSINVAVLLSWLMIAGGLAINIFAQHISKKYVWNTETEDWDIKTKKFSKAEILRGDKKPKKRVLNNGK